jgi:hypothetical protein
VTGASGPGACGFVAAGAGCCTRGGVCPGTIWPPVAAATGTGEGGVGTDWDGPTLATTGLDGAAMDAAGDAAGIAAGAAGAAAGEEGGAASGTAAVAEYLAYSAMNDFSAPKDAT